MRGLESVANKNASMDIRLNSGALAETGRTLEDGAEQVHTNLLNAGWQVESPVMMNASSLRNFPSTWAKRLAFGRDPRAIVMTGCI